MHLHYRHQSVDWKGGELPCWASADCCCHPDPGMPDFRLVRPQQPVVVLPIQHMHHLKQMKSVLHGSICKLSSPVNAKKDTCSLVLALHTECMFVSMPHQDDRKPVTCKHMCKRGACLCVVQNYMMHNATLTTIVLQPCLANYSTDYWL